MTEPTKQTQTKYEMDVEEAMEAGALPGRTFMSEHGGCYVIQDWCKMVAKPHAALALTFWSIRDPDGLRVIAWAGFTRIYTVVPKTDPRWPKEHPRGDAELLMNKAKNDRESANG